MELVVGAAVIGAWVSGHRCVVWTLLGVVAGCAAYAQDVAPVVPAASDASDAFVLELVKAGGLPMVLGISGYLLSRGGVPVVVRVSDEDRRLVERWVEERERDRRGGGR